MDNKRDETLKSIEKIISCWKNKEISESSALDDVYDKMSEYSDWEDNEMRRLMNEELKKTSITIKTDIKYMGKLPIPPIEFE